MAAWKLPAVVAAIAVPIVLGFAIGGAGLGVAVGALAGVVLLVVAARQKPREAIGAPAPTGRFLLLVVTCAIADPEAVGQIAAAIGDAEGAEVLVLSPASIRFLDRWTSDVEGARHSAQENLVVTVAALAKAGITAEARVGDEDVVQAVEDQLQGFPATEVILVSEGEEGKVKDAALELRSRLRADFRHVLVGPA